jgi:hypothetical protein
LVHFQTIWKLAFLWVFWLLIHNAKNVCWLLYFCPPDIEPIVNHCIVVKGLGHFYFFSLDFFVIVLGGQKEAKINGGCWIGEKLDHLSGVTLHSYWLISYHYSCNWLCQHNFQSFSVLLCCSCEQYVTVHATRAVKFYGNMSK